MGGVLRRALVTVAGNALALTVAAALFDGIRVGGPTTSTGEDVLSVLLVGVVLGLVNAVVAPLVKLLSLPFIIVTLGLFLLLVNAALLRLTAELADALDLAFRVHGFWTYVGGALVISLVAWAVDLAADD